jgi:hypothetical protein
MAFGQEFGQEFHAGKYGGNADIVIHPDSVCDFTMIEVDDAKPKNNAWEKLVIRYEASAEDVRNEKGELVLNYTDIIQPKKIGEKTRIALGSSESWLFTLSLRVSCTQPFPKSPSDFFPFTISGNRSELLMRSLIGTTGLGWPDLIPTILQQSLKRTPHSHFMSDAVLVEFFKAQVIVFDSFVGGFQVQVRHGAEIPSVRWPQIKT